ncbi:PaaI family thioesterase [Nocardia thraciensis]
MTETVILPEHVHGYPDVAFGGYVAGMLARRTGSPVVRVDFRSIVPVATEVGLGTTDTGWALTAADGRLLVEAAPADVTIETPTPPSWAEAKLATDAAVTSPERQVTDCYGCGAVCAPGRGLRLFPWLLPERDLIAAAWQPDPGLAADNGVLPPEIVWSALDCPGGVAGIALGGMRYGAFTAALTATQLRPLLAGDEYISYAWPIRADGRKHTVGVALSTPEGDLCALAEALWIGPKD